MKTFYLFYCTFIYLDKNRHYVELLRIINADSNLKNIYMQILSTENYSTKNNLSTLTTTQTTGEYGRNTSSSCSLTGDGSGGGGGGGGFIGKFSSTRS